MNAVVFLSIGSVQVKHLLSSNCRECARWAVQLFCWKLQDAETCLVLPNPSPETEFFRNGKNASHHRQLNTTDGLYYKEFTVIYVA